jgi:hypothetical protein
LAGAVAAQGLTAEFKEGGFMIAATRDDLRSCARHIAAVEHASLAVP